MLALWAVHGPMSPTPFPDDGLPPLPVSLAVERLRLLRIRSIAILRYHRPNSPLWPFCTVEQEGDRPLWSVSLLAKCCESCKGHRCDETERHDYIFGVSGPSSLSTFRRFRDRIRRISGWTEKRIARNFVRGPEDRAEAVA